jgi:hypothetical protein
VTVAGPAPTFGLLAPLTPMRGGFAEPTAPVDGDGGLVDVIRESRVDALWLRDLPVTPTDDDDAGQGTDPFVHLAHLAGAGVLPPVVGTASVILGTRHPDALARAALTLQAGPESAFCAQLDELCRVSGRQLDVGVRIDATVVPSAEATPDATPERGRVVGTVGQLAGLVVRWRRMPVTHLLDNIRSADPRGDLRRLAEA